MKSAMDSQKMRAVSPYRFPRNGLNTCMRAETSQEDPKISEVSRII